KKLKKAFNKDEVSIRPNGTLDNVELYFPNEAARHKLLDIIGDLALVGTRIRGKVIANKPGHKINTNFAKELEKKIRLERRKNNNHKNNTKNKNIRKKNKKKNNKK